MYVFKNISMKTWEENCKEGRSMIMYPQFSCKLHLSTSILLYLNLHFGQNIHLNPQLKSCQSSASKHLQAPYFLKINIWNPWHNHEGPRWTGGLSYPSTFIFWVSPSPSPILLICASTFLPFSFLTRNLLAIYASHKPLTILFLLLTQLK